MYKLAVLVSGGGTNLQAIIDRIADGKLKDIEITVVIASKSGIAAVDRAEIAEIPWQVINRNDYPDKYSWDKAMLEALSRFQPDLIVLAGYLSLLGTGVIRRWSDRIINVHPSLIPSFCGPGFYGLKVHEAALEAGVKITGATVHLVDEKYDSGPIILQKAVAVEDGDTPESLQKRVMIEAEQVILPQAIELMAKGLVKISKRRTRIQKEDIK